MSDFMSMIHTATVGQTFLSAGAGRQECLPHPLKRWAFLCLFVSVGFFAPSPKCLVAGEAVAPAPALSPDGKPLSDEQKRDAGKISDEDLTRVAVAPTARFPWSDKPQPVKPVTPKPADKNAPAKPAAPGAPGTAPAGDSSMDLSGDMVIKSFGPFTRELKKSRPDLDEPDKEHVTVTQNVEIEMIETDSVLRAQNVVIVRDIKSGETELLEATGGVELDSPDSAAKGDMVRFEMQKNSAGEFVKNQFTLIGDPIAKKKATLWLRPDPTDREKYNKIEATRFFRDLRLETFRATGFPNAIVLPPEDPDETPPADAKTDGSKEKSAVTLGAPATPKPNVTLGAAPKAGDKVSKSTAKSAGSADKTGKTAAAAPGDKAAPKPGGTGMSGMSLSGAGKVNMRADAELFFDGPTGKMTLTNNVQFIKEGPTAEEGAIICADNAIVTMEVPLPGQPPPPGGAFGGDMKFLDCTGRVEIKSGTQTILCDKMKLDNERHVLYTEMNNPSDTVQVYNQNLPIGGSLILAPKTLEITLDTQDLKAGGPMKMRSFMGPPASNRGNGPKPEDIKPIPDAHAKPVTPDPKAKPADTKPKPVPLPKGEK